MKNITMLLLAIFAFSTTYAQIVTEQDIELYNGEELIFKKDKIDYVESALNIKELYGLDKNNAITRTTIVDAPGKTKDEIYIEVNNWFIHSFNSGKSVIQLNEKSSGVIIGKGYISHIADHTSIASNSIVNAWVIIRVDIRDDKFRVMTTIQEYDIDMGQGVLGALSGTGNPTSDVKWLPRDCFPFTGNKYKKTTSKAFVNCHIWIQIVSDKLIDAVLSGITGDENEW